MNKLKENFPLLLDSYKLGHYKMLLPKTTTNYSYYEARTGAKFDYTVFFGLQYYLKEYLQGTVVTQEAIDFAREFTKAHLGSDCFNTEGWQYILDKHEGKLPVRIKAVPEGSRIPVSNVLMTIENTDPNCAWLTNTLESLLSEVWYPISVATLSYETKKIIQYYKTRYADSLDGVEFMLHDFGMRSASSLESAAIGGAAHLVNFRGTDTVPAMLAALEYYNADLSTLAFSVAASEHSVMTAAGADSEAAVVRHLFNEFPTGILSIVADSYNIYNFVDNIIGKAFKETILNRDGITVIRPDSCTPEHKTPAEMVVWIAQSLENNFGFRFNSKGRKIFGTDKIKILYGDGLKIETIDSILGALDKANYSPDVIATFGQGGYLLHKGVDRDMERFAFKVSAQERDGIWHNVFKNPVDVSKASKKGRLKLVKDFRGTYCTVPETDEGEDILVTVFENGSIIHEYSFDEIRERAQTE